MAIPWSQVETSSAYLRLSPDDKEAARQQYFDDVVKPRVSPNDLTTVKSQFDQATKSKYAPSVTRDEAIEGMSGAGQFLAGAGQALHGIGQGIGQKVGLTSEADVAKSRADEAFGGINRNTRARIGNIVGGAEAMAPAALIPGANTIAGSAAIGAGLGAMQPHTSGYEELTNIGLGGATGGALTALGKALPAGWQMLKQAAGREAPQASPTTTTFTGKQVPKSPEQLRHEQNVTTAIGKGYTVPPTQGNPRLLNKLLEGVSGKQQTAQLVSEKNQTAFNNDVKRALGIPENELITPEHLEAIREQAGRSYANLKGMPTQIKLDPQFRREVNGLGQEFSNAAAKYPQLMHGSGIDHLVSALNQHPEMSPTEAIELVKSLRFQAKANLRNMADPQKLALGIAQRQAAEEIDNLVERNVASSGMPSNAVADYKAARKLIAQTYDVESSLNEATGSISGKALARLSKKRPLSGELKDIADFAKAFPKAAQNVEQIGSQPGISPWDLFMGETASAAAHKPGLLATIPGRGVVRSAITSGPYQRAFVAPSPDVQSLINPSLPFGAIPAVTGESK